MVSPPLLPLADLHKPADLLPRTARGTLDADAALRLFGLKDVAVLWQQKYPSGSAGAALKRVVGAIGRKPARRAIRLRLGLEDLSPGANPDTERPPAPLRPPKPETNLPQPATKVSAAQDSSALPLPRDASRRIDIAASLELLGLPDPKTLWVSGNALRPRSASYVAESVIEPRSMSSNPLGNVCHHCFGDVPWLPILIRRAFAFPGDEQVIELGIQLECDLGLSAERFLPVAEIHRGGLVIPPALQDEQWLL